jgi:hypothetical protein
MKYCTDTTLNHPASASYPECIINLNSLLEREGLAATNDLLLQTQLVIDGDVLESKVSEKLYKPKHKSMDMIIGVSDNIQREMLLADFKFRLGNAKTLNKEAMEAKVAGTMCALGDTTPIFENYYFIVDSSFVEQAKNRLARMNPRIPNKYIATEINDFISLHFT